MIQIANIPTQTYTANGVAFEMVTVEKRANEKGEYDFMMGDDTSNYNDEKPVHRVTFQSDFEIGKYPVTQALWEAVMGKDNNPSSFKGENRPVEQVSWDNIVLGNKEKKLPAFLDKLNAILVIQKQNLVDGKQFRLPTEAQWEYAARGGKFWEELYYQYAGSNHLKEVAWFWNNRYRETKPVGLKMPNVLGLYDMSGNVREWCEDNGWHENYEGAPEAGSAWIKRGKENTRVIRSGSWGNNDCSCRVAFRDWEFSTVRNFDIGFRLSRY